MKSFIAALSNSRRGLALLALILFLALGLTACKDTGDQPPAEPEAPTPPPPPPPPPEPADRCPPACELSVTLPADPSEPPTVSNPVFRVKGGASVAIVLVDQSGRPAQGATVLRFRSKQESPFVNRGGQPMKTVPLNRGNNGFSVRNYADGVCSEEQGGCKYDVVNTGEPGRPILDPHVIIWQ